MKFILTILSVITAQLCLSQSEQIELIGIDKEITELIEEYNAVGLSVAVVKDDCVIYNKGFGYRDLELKLPVNETTAFHIASITKAFTGSLLGILESQNKLSLEDKPALHVPNFQFYNEKMDNLITIEDLLSHKTGIGNQGSSIVLFPTNDKLQTVQRLQYLKPEGEIKNSWIYSNIGYTLAGTIAEQITNKSWDTIIKENIFTPLSMNSSFTTVTEMEQTNNFSKGYGVLRDEIELVNFENYYAYTPAGAIKSSSLDLTKWMRTWLNNGEFNKTQVIPKKYVKDATSLQNIKDDIYEKNSFLYGEGFGWQLRSWEGFYRVHHGGNTNGFSAVMHLFPFENIGIVVLTNQQNSLLPYAVSDLLARKLLKLADFDFPIIVDDIYKKSIEDLPINVDKQPMKSLKDFTGKYVANGFGEVEIVKEKNYLFAVFPTYKFQLAHLNYNSFYLRGTEEFSGVFNPEFTIKFENNTEGEIDVLRLFSQKEPVVFKKQ